MRGGYLVDDRRQRAAAERQELEQADDREQTVEPRVEGGKDEATEAVGDHERLLSCREAHLRLRGRAHAEQPAARLGHEALRGRRGEPRDRDRVLAIARGEARVHGEEVPVVEDAAAVVRDEDLLAAGVDDDAAGRAERARDRAELALLLLEVLE